MPLSSSALSPDDLRPALGLQLRPAQIAALEGVTGRTVQSWIQDGLFGEYTRLPGKGEYRVSLGEYLEFRRRQRVRVTIAEDMSR